MESVNMEAVGVNISDREDQDVLINVSADDLTATDVTIPDGVLDDKLLDVVTPRLALTDDTVADTVRPTFCTRCRTISATFLSGSYVSSSGALDNLSVVSHERCQMRDSQPRFTLGETLDTDGLDTSDDDVPLLRDEDGVDGNDGFSTTVGVDHCHAPRPSNAASKKAMTKLLLASCLTTVFLIGEAAGGYLANSIAIMSDAAHLLSDLTSFIVSLTAIYFAMRPASKKMNFGYYRAEVLGAVISVLLIWVITGVLVYAAILRVIDMDFEVEADTMIIVAAIGIVINIILGVVLHVGPGGHGHGHSHGGHSHGSRTPSHSTTSNNNHNSTTTTPNPETPNQQQQNLNVRAAFIHVLGDLVQSVGVLIAAYIIRFYPEYKIADPICTFLFSVLVIFTTVPILRDLSNVLMEGTPPGVDYIALTSDLTALPGVKMVHSLHLWSLTLDKNACSVHLAISPETDSEVVLRDAQKVMRIRHQIFHVTIQVERYQPLLMDTCQQCQPFS